MSEMESREATMREKIAERSYFEGEYFEEGTIAYHVWLQAKATFYEYGKGTAVDSFIIANQIISLICTDIEGNVGGMENPYQDNEVEEDLHLGFECCRKSTLQLVQRMRGVSNDKKT